MSIPTCTAWAACSRLMATPRVISLVPRITFLSMIPSTGEAIPTSTGKTHAPAGFAIWQTLEQLRTMLAATKAVTSWPVCVTPWATTPLSAHMARTARREMSIFSLPVMPAMRTTSASSSPRLPMGLAIEFHCSTARAAAALSKGAIRAFISSKFMQPPRDVALGLNPNTAKIPARKLLCRVPSIPRRRCQISTHKNKTAALQRPPYRGPESGTDA